MGSGVALLTGLCASRDEHSNGPSPIRGESGRSAFQDPANRSGGALRSDPCRGRRLFSPAAACS